MRRLRFPSIVALGIVLTTVLGGPVTVQGQEKDKSHAGRKLDRALQDKLTKSARRGRERVIVRVRPEAIEQAQALFKKRGHGIRRFNRLIRSFVIDAKNLEETRRIPVRRVDFNRRSSLC